MQIVELGDCSMVIMKDSEDAPWESVGDAYRIAKKKDYKIWVTKICGSDGNYVYGVYQVADDCIYTAGRLILFFKDPVDRWNLHDRVSLHHTCI